MKGHFIVQVFFPSDSASFVTKQTVFGQTLVKQIKCKVIVAELACAVRKG